MACFPDDIIEVLVLIQHLLSTQVPGTELVTGHTVVLTDQTVPPQNSYIEFLTADTSG